MPQPRESDEVHWWERGAPNVFGQARDCWGPRSDYTRLECAGFVLTYLRGWVRERRRTV